MQIAKTVLQAVVVIGSGFITINLTGIILKYLFPSLDQPEIFSPGLLFLSYAFGIVVMVILVIYFSKKNKNNPSKK